MPAGNKISEIAKFINFITPHIPSTKIRHCRIYRVAQKIVSPYWSVVRVWKILPHFTLICAGVGYDSRNW